MKYRRDIDGLRALAVLPVIFFHAGFSFFRGGFVGVDIFFVISGYLITSIILADREANLFSLSNFYSRRARRIFPPLLLMLLSCLPFAWFWLLPNDMKAFCESLVAAPAFLSNIFFYITTGYFDNSTELKPLIHTWSLAVEEQYYLIFPVLILSIWRMGKRQIIILLGIIFIVSFVFAQYLSVARPSFAFYMLPTRSWEILLGSFIAFYIHERSKNLFSQLHEQIGSCFGFFLIIYSIFSFDNLTPFPGVYALIPTFGASLIILFSTNKTWVGKLLGSKFFVKIGLISYSAYLWHQPLFAFARVRNIGDLSVLAICMLIGTTFLLAYFSWRFVELPFRDSNRFTNKQIFTYATIGSFLFIIFGFLGYLSNGYEFRVPPKYLPVDYFQKSVYLNGNKFGIDGKPCVSDIASICKVAMHPGAKNILLVGDSHSGDYTVEFQKFIIDNGLSGSQFSINGCGFLASQVDRHNGDCGRAIRLLNETLSTHKFDVVIFIIDLYSHAGSPANTLALNEDMGSLNKLVALMANTSNEVWFFTPRYVLSVPPMQAALMRQLSRVFIVPAVAENSIDNSLEKLKIYSNLHIYNERDYLVKLGGAAAEEKFNGHTVDMSPIYRDSNHLTNYGAQLSFSKFLSISKF